MARIEGSGVMKVLFLGAGASASAGYPLAYQLLPAVRQFYVDTSGVRERGALNDWDKVIESAEQLGLSRELLENPNPEIPLSYLDLWAQAAQEAPVNFMRAARAGTFDESDLSRWSNDRVRTVIRARDAIQTLLADYFATRTYEDYMARPAGRQGLRRILASLAAGDIVITLNWDTTAEMTLAEAGRWCPVDGYGLRHRSVRAARGLDPPELRKRRWKSDVVVLKLHGGVGWKVERYVGDRVYLSYASLLQHLPTVLGRAEVYFNESVPELGTVEPFDNLLEVPSYLKQVARVPDLEVIWARAAGALRAASEIEVWGYGLPDSDGEVRLLLSGLRARLVRGKVRVAVHDPSGDARDRWVRLLGSRASVDGARL
jgi:hypothetical protein